MSSMTQLPREWLIEAVRRIEADFNRSSDTHLIHHEVAAFPGVHLYFKDESSHPTGSLKHRLARSLILYALCNEWVGPQTTLIESSSGSTAVSEAYFARLLGLRFIAVVPKSVAQAKIDAIRFQGGEVHGVDDPNAVYAEAQRLADETGGHYLDQFTYAERATDWRGNNNIAESLFSQMTAEPYPVPTWLVTGAGTGGTSATLGRYIRYRRLPTRLCVADPEGSVFHRHYHDRSVQLIDRCGSCIEGIGRPRVEPSFIPSLIDHMEVVTDAQSIAAVRLLSERLGRRVGGSTGTNLWACVRLMQEMAQKGETGSIVTILCDGGERYADTYYNDGWLSARAIDWRSPYADLKSLMG
ncbi:PLP-dependent cysteine synthase family protein [Asticcacaulis excentricus]|uniref:L-cysteine desulfhydrase Cds1 n=1 Tax=Asticcacaulis excentricus (strain ATCC 15261 / DSM 4724 / KCTC 12464 / NCIMB 9791 / VKM B-1370 / CB 48) TaxID=573065 RepID=E8RP30_ASTEC|nr:PLP-dependent cysteine synthase family protein [Asticcacaulis excentricus]ADU13000.1 Pyridoxal-5'-phosphate-dependent protein beta subunit [Asticcacaulis excentricus CB 48]